MLHKHAAQFDETHPRYLVLTLDPFGGLVKWKSI